MRFEMGPKAEEVSHKKPKSLRTIMIGLMVFLVLLQSVVLIGALTFSRVFDKLDAEAFRLLISSVQSRQEVFDESMGALMSEVAQVGRTVEKTLIEVAAKAGYAPREIYLHNEVYNAASVTVAGQLVDLLQRAHITGAFFFLNASNTDIYDANARSGVYLRNMAPGSWYAAAADYQMEIGPIAVAQAWHLATGRNWDLHLPLDREGGSSDFYSKPLWAATEFPALGRANWGYWAPPKDILEDRQEAITYSVPLIDAAGNPYGVFGIEINMTYLAQAYLRYADQPYSGSFYSVAPLVNDVLHLDWIIPGGPEAQLHLPVGGAFRLQPVTDQALYSLNLEGHGETYTAYRPLTLYGKASPFAAESWYLFGFAAKGELRAASRQVRAILMGSVLITASLAVLASVVLGLVSTRRIRGLSEQVQTLSPQSKASFLRTDLREIDDLMAAIEMFSQSVFHAAETTSKILGLTGLPLGGFEISEGSNYVFASEYIYDILELPRGSSLTLTEWQDQYARLIREPRAGYSDVYRFQSPRGTQWLRILEAVLPEGRVGVVADVTGDVEENLRLARELDYDPLTHLFNCVAFWREAEAQIRAQPNKVGAMVFSDLDNLKYINDTFGHDTGDQLIVQAGEMFRQFNSFGGITARISGDEFAVLLHGFESKAEIMTIVQAQLADYAKYSLLTPDGEMQRLRFSSGLAWYPDDAASVKDLLKLSDYAMYEAKQNAKGSLYAFNEKSYQANAYLLANRESINRLLDEGLIRFDFQPIVCCKSGEVMGYEALMRSLLPEFNSPTQILTVATAESKLGMLERLVMFKAFEALATQQARLGGRKIFINSIPSQLLSSADQRALTERFTDLLEHVVLEITEEESENPDRMVQKLSFARENKIMLAVDDFGRGYSNEVRIVAMQPNFIKIDMELIQGIHAHDDKRQLVENLLSFCHPRGISVVAEGVENYADLRCLVSIGIDYVQGFYLARPAPVVLPLAAAVRDEILSLNAKPQI